MTLDEFQFQALALRAAYCRIRYERIVNKRRKWYRIAAKEKVRLAGLGFDSELIRLYGLYLRRPEREDRLERFENAFNEFLQGPRQLRLF